MSNNLDLLKKLISEKSITIDKTNCLSLIKQALAVYGFNGNIVKFGQTNNLFISHKKNFTGKHFLFSGHTDVVPPGNEKLWFFNPFIAVVKNGICYGRGVVDMKGSISCMVNAIGKFVKRFPNYQGNISLLITTDEEGDGYDGTVKMVDYLLKSNYKFDGAIVGEPSSIEKIGDTIKYGKRGSITASIKIIGKQGHVGYPHLAINPIHQALIALLEIKELNWFNDENKTELPATTLQIVDINSKNDIDNIIPNCLDIKINLRFNNIQSEEYIKQQIINILLKYNLKFEISWKSLAQPFLSSKTSDIMKCSIRAIEKFNLDTELKTNGGTSDARFIAKMCDVIELGLLNKTMHQINEAISIKDLTKLTMIYHQILKNFFLINN